jgi:putative PIN family toxin of toxin-antitoxin system
MHDTVYGVAMNRVVIDTNIIASGLRSNQGASFKLLSLLDQDLFKPVVTVPLVLEYEKILNDPRLQIPFSSSDIGKYIDYICSRSECLKVHFLWRPFLSDGYDDMVLEAAVCGQCKHIVTYNIKDFDGCNKFGIEAIAPKDYLKIPGVIE